MLGQSLSLSQSQQLKLNLRMIQSLEMMTLSLPELEEKVSKAAETNPVLNTDGVGEKLSESYEDYAAKIKKKENVKDDYSDSSYYSPDDGDSHRAWLEGAVSSGESLNGHLMSQLGLIKADKDTIKAAEIIISSLDSNGFFTEEPDRILPKDLRTHVRDAIRIINTLDPIGVGAWDYKDSLIIQARAMGLSGEEEKTFSLMVKGCLHLLKAGKMAEAAKELGTGEDEVNALYSFLKTLNPYPGALYSDGFKHYVMPDFSVKKEDGKLVFRMNDGNIPDVTIDEGYMDMAKGLSSSKDEKEKEASKYLKKQINEAESLITQLRLRKSTLEKVALTLIKKQKAFFLFGPQSLKPMILKDVAEEIGVHETTVSRITTNKYVDTDYGIYPLKVFFSSALKSDKDDDGIAKNAVKEMVREIIENNKTGKKLSDQKISDALKEKGITCARRTVSKYRAELGLDSSFER